MAPVCLASEWQSRLTEKNWGATAVSRIQLCWASSTLRCYNSVLQKFQQFCSNNGVCFPPNDTAILAMFFCSISDNSDRPKASLNTAVAAINALNKVGACPIYCDFDIMSLVNALIKSGTKHAMKKSKVLPKGVLNNMFLKWDDNDMLKLKHLRMKCIALLAIAFMLRPSDIAPKGVLYNPEDGSIDNLVFSTDDISFPEDGGLCIRLLGTKMIPIGMVLKFKFHHYQIQNWILRGVLKHTLNGLLTSDRHQIQYLSRFISLIQLYQQPQLLMF